MTIQPISGDNSTGSNNNQINNAFRQLNREQEIKTFKQANGSVGLASGILPNNQGYGELLYDSTGLARIALRIKDNAPEFKISKPTFDVLTATDAQLIFNSNQNVFKIVAKGTTSIPSYTIAATNITAKLVTIAHGLSFVPIVNAYAQASIFNFPSTLIATSYVPLPITGSWQTGLGGYLFSDNTASYYNLDVVFAVDSTNVYFQATFHNTSVSPITFNAILISYFLLQETAT